MASGRMTIKASKTGAKSVPVPGIGGSFVLGSRPGSLRSPPVPRVTPLDGQTQYGKVDPGTGLTGRTSRS